MQQRETDIIIYGAGPAGLAAALEAATAGASVQWLCETPALGGGFSAGYQNSVEGHCDHPVFDQMQPLFTSAWKHKYYEPNRMEGFFHRQLDHTDVQWMTDVRLLQVKTGKNRILRVKVASDMGLEKLAGGVFIDASDNGLLSRLAGGEPLKPHDGWYTLGARVGGLDTRLRDVYDATRFGDMNESFTREVLAAQPPFYLDMPRMAPLPQGGMAILHASLVRLPGLPCDRQRVRRQLIAQTESALKVIRREMPGWQGAHVVEYAAAPVRVNPSHMIGRDVRRNLLARDGETAACTLGGIPCTLANEHMISLHVDNLILTGGAVSVGSQAAVAYQTLPGRIACGAAAGALANEALVYDGAAYPMLTDATRRLFE